jgi:hypothetical protein
LLLALGEQHGSTGQYTGGNFDLRAENRELKIRHTQEKDVDAS